MLSNIKSMSLHGLDGYVIHVQVDVSGGIPCWEIVGLPDTSVKESKERVKAAIRNSGYDLQSRKVVVNLAPADTKKEGSFFDLPIAIGVLECIGEIPKQDLSDMAFIGELSLDGKINRVNGVLPMCIEAKRLGIKKVILSKENAKEAQIIDGIQALGVEKLQDVVFYLNNQLKIEAINVKIEEIFDSINKYKIDFSEVKGQENVKRALEIAAAGGHNCLLIGSPGSRKNYACKKNANYTSKSKF